MNKQTYAFYLTSGSIPGIASDQPDGLFHAGLLVDVDLDSMKVLSTRLINTETGETAASKGLIDPSTGEAPVLSSFMSEKQEEVHLEAVVETTSNLEANLTVKDEEKTVPLKKAEISKEK